MKKFIAVLVAALAAVLAFGLTACGGGAISEEKWDEIFDTIFTMRQYEVSINYGTYERWKDGDWNGDGTGEHYSNDHYYVDLDDPTGAKVLDSYAQHDETTDNWTYYKWLYSVEGNKMWCYTYHDDFFDEDGYHSSYWTKYDATESGKTLDAQIAERVDAFEILDHVKFHTEDAPEGTSIENIYRSLKAITSNGYEGTMDITVGETRFENAVISFNFYSENPVEDGKLTDTIDIMILYAPQVVTEGTKTTTTYESVNIRIDPLYGSIEIPEVRE